MGQLVSAMRNVGIVWGGRGEGGSSGKGRTDRGRVCGQIEGRTTYNVLEASQ